MNKSYGLRVEYLEYTVKKGDSLYSIAKSYNTTVSELIDINMLTSNTIYPGQIILIPQDKSINAGPMEDYIIEFDETIEGIANKLNIDPSVIGKYNDFGKIKLCNGQVIKVPRGNVYTIQPGDTIASILAKTKASAEQILKANSDHFLKPGVKINL